MTELTESETARISAERSRALTMEYFRAELAKIQDALIEIETADVDDWNTFAEQFAVAGKAANNLASRFLDGAEITRLATDHYPLDDE